MEKYQVFELDVVLAEIAEYTACSLGKEVLAQSEVSFSFLEIEREIARMKNMLAIIVHHGDLPFGGVSDIALSLRKAGMDATLSAYELITVANFCDACAKLLDFMKKLDIPYPALADVIASIVPHVQLAQTIRPCFAANNEVADHASPKLRDIRRKMKQCESSINSQLEKFMNAHAGKLMDHVIAKRNERSVVYVKISEKNSVRGILHGESTSGQTAYIEPEAVISLNNALQALISAENDEIIRILFELSQHVKACKDDLSANVETMGYIDALAAKAKWGKKQNACMPSFTKDNSRFYIKLARHPLIDSKKVIANTIEIPKEKRVLLITGPNTGGKTVNLKVIGLFTLMTYLAIPLPCEEAEISLFDAIYMDIGDDQSIQQSLSTFSAHLTKLAYICEHATKNSLVLIDEFGSGTDPKEGESLAMAILNHLRRNQATVIATTHYSRLKMYGLKHPDIMMAQVEFDLDLMQPTFRFLIGSTGQSNALEIARRIGMREGIVKDAIHIKNTAMDEQEQLTVKLEALVNANAQMQEQLRKQLDQEKENTAILEEKMAKWEQERAKMQADAQKEVNAFVEEAKLEAEVILETIKAEAKQQKPHETVELKGKLNQLIKEETIGVSRRITREIAVGDFVELIGLNKIGQVISLDKKSDATVLCNGTKIKVKRSNVVLTNHRAPKPKEPTRASFQRMGSYTIECNLIGMRVEEALLVMEKYLDDMLLANVNSVRIIHGVGSGALRSAVHEKLKRMSFVESYRNGQQGEGGVGATVVTLGRGGK